jgi:hypothetical protein
VVVGILLPVDALLIAVGLEILIAVGLEIPIAVVLDDDGAFILVRDNRIVVLNKRIVVYLEIRIVVFLIAIAVFRDKRLFVDDGAWNLAHNRIGNILFVGDRELFGIIVRRLLFLELVPFLLVWERERIPIVIVPIVVNVPKQNKLRVRLLPDF